MCAQSPLPTSALDQVNSSRVYIPPYLGIMAWFVVLGLAYVLSIHDGHATPPRVPHPVRPTYQAHLKRQQGPVASYQRYAFYRVGGCTQAPDKPSLLDQLGSLHPYQHCPKVTPLSHSLDSSLSLDRGPRSLNDPLSIASMRQTWRAASAQQDTLQTYRSAALLRPLPSPQRTAERLQLSEAYELLRSLDHGPISYHDLSPKDALHRLDRLSKDALGSQVRARSLHALTQWGSPEQSTLARTTLWTDLPQSVLSKRLSVAPSSPDWLRRGEAAFKERDYQLTIDAMQRFSPLQSQIEWIKPPSEPLSSSQSSRDRNEQRAALLIAISLMRLRVHTDEADHQLHIAASGPDPELQASAIYYQAHLFSRLKRWDESLERLNRYIKVGPRGRRKREAKYQLGRVLHQAGRYREAVIAQRSYLKTKPKDRVMYEWFLGWSYFRAGDCRNAIKVWQSLTQHKNLIVGPKALYWTARCQVINQQKRRALKTLAKLNRVAPLGYYALLSQDLLARLKGQPFKWRNPIRRHRRRHWSLAAPIVPKKSLKKLRRSSTTRPYSQKIDEVLQLVGLGEEGLARVKAKPICGASQVVKLLKRRLGARSTYSLCDQLFYYTGDHGKLWRRQASRRVAWRSGLHKRSPLERVGAYPLAYYDLSVAAAEIETISPWWLMAHMLQESRYRPDVVSYAQAIGLLQILGRTGLRIHQRLNWPKGNFSSDLLYDPALSIRYAAWYLHHLSDDLGHPLLAIGAYNGGPMRFADHQDAFQGQPFDLMVEEMGAHESRNYLRKVADHFIRYLALYGSDEEWTAWTTRLAPPEYTPTPQRSVGF